MTISNVSISHLIWLYKNDRRNFADARQARGDWLAVTCNLDYVESQLIVHEELLRAGSLDYDTGEWNFK